MQLPKAFSTKKLERLLPLGLLDIGDELERLGKPVTEPDVNDISAHEIDAQKHVVERRSECAVGTGHLSRKQRYMKAEA
jgi:hypothetical protein